MSPEPPSVYRLAPLVLARLLGAALLLLAVATVVATVLVAVLGGPADVVVVVVLVGLVAFFASGAWLRARAYVVRLDDDGYRVRMIRGAGVHAARWADVERVVASHPRDIPCLVLRLRDGRSTTVPVEALAADRDRFAHDVRARLEAASRTTR